MIKKIVATFALIIMLFVLLVVGTIIVRRHKQALEYSVTSTRLKNGLTVRILKTDQPNATLYIRYNTGFKNEPTNKPGLAHLLEHLIYNDKEGLSRSLKIVDLQAFTGYDRTTYKKEFVPEYLETALKDEAFNMSSAVFTQKQLEIEKSLIENESAIFLSEPFNTFKLKLTENMNDYYSSKFRSHNNPDFKSINLQDVTNFYKTNYTPTNTVILLAGNINKKKALDLIKKYFENIPGKEISRNNRPEFFKSSNKTIYGKHRQPGAFIFIGFPRPSRHDKNFEAYEIALKIAENNLWQMAYASNGEINNIDSDIIFSENTIISATISDPVKCRLYEKKLKLFFENLTSIPPGPKEIEFFKKYLSTDSYNAEELIFNGSRKPVKNNIRFAKVSDFEIKEALSRYFNMENAVLLVAEGKKYTSMPLKQVNQKVAINNYPAPKTNYPPETYIYKTKTGITIAVIPDSQNRGFTIKGRIMNAGSKMESERCAALLTSCLLKNGTKKDGCFLPESLVESNIKIDGKITLEGLDFDVTGTDINAGIKYLANYLKELSFKSSDFLSEKNTLMSRIVSSKSEPVEYALCEFNKILFSHNTLREYSICDYEAFANLTEETIKSFYKSSCFPARTFIAVSCNTKPEKVSKEIEAALSDWKNPEKSWAVPQISYNKNKILKSKIKVLGSFVCYIVKGMEAPSLSNPDFKAFEAVYSVLYERLYSKRFETGIWYSFDVKPGPYGWNACVSANPEKLALAEKLFGDEIKKLTTSGITQSEAERAIKKLQIKFEAEISSNGGKLGLMRNFYGTGVDPFNTKYSYSNLTVKELNNIAKKYIRPENLITVTAESESIHQNRY